MRNAVLGLGVLAAVALGVLGICSVPAVAADEVKISKVNLEDLSKAVAAHKGKIVVIDIWATFCPPCKEKFPHMVELHNKLKDKGVVFMSLSVDEPADMPNALEFLQGKKAFFTNYLLDDTDKNKEAWEDKFAHQSPPIVHVFDRSGKLQTLEGKKIATLDKLLEELIEKK
ncbi:TlpA disulfide reductase family protein [Zavarzinella formosa]|uniref:TlpA disulfide reductase family protein n=1 Tax=Zavarzinella formosa TaxID=360055 RepID=UPI000314D38A|nr:TlpA disulfide reductase family protein [Zavarzinella formosa]